MPRALRQIFLRLRALVCGVFVLRCHLVHGDAQVVDLLWRFCKAEAHDGEKGVNLVEAEATSLVSVAIRIDIFEDLTCDKGNLPFYLGECVFR